MKKELRNILFLILFFTGSVPLFAGPPFDTDDPVPVEYEGWEIYISAHPVHEPGEWDGEVPLFDMNYGALPGLQLACVIPLGFNSPNSGRKTYGLGDAELGFKYRLLKENNLFPVVSVYPKIILPLGNEEKGLGEGSVQFSLPVWLQKNFGEWTINGGAGYNINTDDKNKNTLFTGIQIQRQVFKNLTLGAEVYNISGNKNGDSHQTKFNIGFVYDFSSKHHFLFSAGRTLGNGTLAQAYIGYQLTLGSE